MTVYVILHNAFRNSIFERFHMSCADEIKSWNDPSCDISQFPATEKRCQDFSAWPCNPSTMLNPTNSSLFSFHHHFRFLENNNHPSKAIFPTSHNTVNKHQQIVRTLNANGRLLISWLRKLHEQDFEHNAWQVHFKFMKGIWWVSWPRRNTASYQPQSLLIVFDNFFIVNATTWMMPET